jgi:hypothetical protein
MKSVVYFLRGEDTGAIKIGFTKSLSKRISNIVTASSERVTLLGSVAGDELSEKSLHHEFANDRIRGEWFRPTDALMARIASLIDLSSTHEVGAVLPPAEIDEPFTKQALKWLIAIEDGESLRGVRRDITRKRISKRLNCSATMIENFRYSRKRTPISAQHHQALREAYTDELMAQAGDLSKMLKYVPAHIAIAAETQLAAAREILAGEVK